MSAAGYHSPACLPQGIGTTGHQDPLASSGEQPSGPSAVKTNLHEQAIAITAHRFGTPDGLTDHLL